jgi:site-specific recombinase XerD
MSTATFDTLATLLVADYRLNERRSLSSTENSIAKLRAFFGSGCPVASITYDRLMAFTVSRLEAGRARATVRKELAALKRAFHLIRRSDPAIPLPAFPQVHVSNARRGFLTRAQFNALVDALPPYASAAVRFMYVSGWRRS